MPKSNWAKEGKKVVGVVIVTVVCVGITVAVAAAINYGLAVYENQSLASAYSNGVV